MCIRDSDYTFKVNGGVGGKLAEMNPPSSDTFEVGRFVFDNISNLLCVMIVANIMGGIIIDTFGSLRKEEEERLRDIKESCFICGNTKEVFEKKSEGTGYFLHIKLDHYMWNYIFYMAYLNEKDSNDFSGVETYVQQKIENGDNSWFPFNRAISLKDIEDEQDGRIQRDEASTLEKDVEEVKKQVALIDASFATLLIQKHNL
eukprot:TRINITY_DN3712_c0_g2_i1.p1 TRINITY_DN3712_c0_g2~~TRINITY_DN3712_c0_g2_i1.p1  ORF type:complete len:223 (-),score=53.58 TRINITY_DN3712_c0_g2_i1:43-648(-)